MNSPRFFFYSHDTYGLGHIRRTLALTKRVASQVPGASFLIATGSARAHRYTWPEQTRILRLPGILKQSDGTYRSRTEGLPCEQVVQLRSDLLAAAWRTYAPHVTVVDHAPVGALGELRQLLDTASRSPNRGRIVLGLRDIIDDAERTRVEWHRAGAWPYVHALYDQVLVYGDRRVLTTADEMGLPERLRDRCRFTGYLAPEPAPRRIDPSAPPRVVVTTGGGGDGMPVLEAWLEFVRHASLARSFQTVMVAGPFLTARRYDRLLEAAPRGVEILRFTADLPELLGTASGVISMAGYNSTVEILAQGIPALLVPRTAPRREQLLRTQRLLGRAPISMGRLDADLMGAFGDFIEEITDSSQRRGASDLRLEGLDVAATEIVKLLPVAARQLEVVPS